MTWTKPPPEIRDPWYRSIIKHPTLTNATKLLLVVLVDDMRVDGRVSVPRSVLAKKMGLHPSRITERIKEAVEAEVLLVVVPGRPGMTAEYRALLPSGAPVRTKRSRKRINADGAPVRTKDMVRLLDQAEVHPSAPGLSVPLGAPVQSPNNHRSTVSNSPAVRAEKRSDGEGQPTHGEHVNSYGVGRCVECQGFEKLGPGNTCSACVIGAAATARSA